MVRRKNRGAGGLHLRDVQQMRGFHNDDMQIMQNRSQLLR